MGSFLPSPHSRLGPIEIDKIYDFYDAPLLFSVRDDLGHASLAYAASSSDIDATYLYLPMSDMRLRRVTTGRMTLREAFQNPERPVVFVVSVPFTDDDVSPSVEEVPPDEVPPAWLPPEGLRMEGPDSNLDPFSEADLLSAARSEQRHLIALEMSPEAGKVGRIEAPLRDAGPLMVEFQAMVDTMSAHADFAFEGVRAASMVILLAPAFNEGLISQAPPDLLIELAGLFQNVGTEGFSEYLTPHSRRTRSHIRDFLEVPSDSNASLDLVIAPPVGEIERRSLPLERIRSGLRYMREATLLPSHQKDFIGHLEGINHPRRTFSVREVPSADLKSRKRKGTPYSGKFDPEVSIEGLSSGLTIRYRFSLVRESQEDEFGQVSFTNRITSLERLADD